MKDCVFDRKESCAALVERDCQDCKFCKTEAELDEGRAKAFERIASLPEDEKNRILEKYHGGRLPEGIA